MLCRGKTAEAAGHEDEDGDEALFVKDIGAPLDLNTTKDIKQSVRRLAAMKGTIPKWQFEFRQQAAGFTHEPWGILLDPSIDRHIEPAEQMCHDWMHATAVSGVCNVIIFLLLRALSAIDGFGRVYEQLYTYLDAWEFPKNMPQGKVVRDLFLSKRATANRRAKAFKAMASEILALLGPLSVFIVRTVVRAKKCLPECKAFLALVDMMDVLQLATTRSCTAQSLRDVVDAFLACIRAIPEWAPYLIPKFHWLEHLADHLARWGLLPNCWVHERKHRVAKRYGQDIRNTSNNERSLLGQVLSHNLHDLSLPGVFEHGVALIGAHIASKLQLKYLRNWLDMGLDADDCMTSRKARILPMGYCCIRDIVLAISSDGVNYYGCEIWFHFQVSRGVYIVVRAYNVKATDPLASTVDWEASDRLFIIGADQILQSVTYTKLDVRNIRTIIPWKLRRYVPVSE